ncbi:MAG: EamA family transporter [Microthrixaceae bacterium]
MAGAAGVFGAAVLWGMIGPLANALADRGIQPVTMATWRALGAGAIFGAVALLRRAPAATPPSEAARGTRGRLGLWGRVALLAAAGVALFYTALPAAVERGGITLAWVLLYTAPAWVLVGSVALGWVRATPRTVGLVAAATVGVALTVLGGGEGMTVSPASVSWGLAAGLGYSSYYLVGRTLVERLGPVRTYAAALTLGGLMLVPIAQLGVPTAEVAALLAVLVVASTALAYLLFGLGLARLSSTRASVIATAEPVVATALAVGVAGERPSAVAYLGGALVIAAALAAALSPA